MAPITRGNSLYTIVDGPSWTQAEANAVKLGGHLVTLNSQSENDFVASKFSQYDAPYIGLTDEGTEGTWRWVSGQDLTWSNWANGAPNGGTGENYSMMYPRHYDGNGVWDDFRNTNPWGEPGIAEIPFIQRGDSAYVIVQGPTWEEAEANAVKLGGHLVTINDEAENMWLTSQFKDILAVPDKNWGGNRSGVWIGLNDKEIDGLPRWASGEQTSYTKFGLYDQESGASGRKDGWILLMLDPSGEAQRRGGLSTWWAEATNSNPSYWLYNYGIAEIKLSSTPTYSLSTSASSINEGSTLTTTVSTTNVNAGTTLYYSLSGTGPSSADFSAGALTGSGTIDANGSFSFSHTLREDLTTEGTETLNIKLFSDSARTTQVGSTVSVTITDNDTAIAKSTFSIDSTNVWEGDTASVVITRSGGLSNAINLTVSTANGTAKAGSDYTSLNSTVTFLVGESSKTISIATKQDTAKESDEAFTVSIGSSDSLAQFSTSTGTVTIEDDDAEKGNTTNNNTNGNNNTVVTGNGNTVNNTTVINNTTNTVNNNTTTNVTNETSTSTSNTTNNTNNITNNFSNIVGNITVDLSSLIQGVSSKSDAISGSAKDDVLGAGKGADKLTGASGADQFVFKTKDSFGNAGADIITDFNPEEGDQLVLSPDALSGLKTNPSLQSVTSKKALKAAQKSDSDLIYYQPLGQLFYDQNGSAKGFGKGGLFAVLSGAPVLTAENLGVI